MSYLRISKSVVTRLAFGGVAMGCAVLVQGCSSFQSTNDGTQSSRLWGNDTTAAAPQPSSYDSDGPTTARPVYRGGRDPVTGRAQEWPPASPQYGVPQYGGAQQTTAVERSALNPLPQAPPFAAQPISPRTAYAPPPPASYAPGAPARGTASGSASVEIKPGDTLYRIAKANNVSVPALMQANSLSNEIVKVGQRLTIPGR